MTELKTVEGAALLRARAEIKSKAIPRRLPLAPKSDGAILGLPLADEVRRTDVAHRPYYVVWEVTLACDLACRHCGSRAGKARPDELTTEECLDLVDQIADMGAKEVTVIGGEAYLRPDWLDIIRKIRSRGMNSTMTTGGRGLTAEMARAAKEAGLQSSSVSIDGAQDTHDRLRGAAGSWEAAWQAAKHLRKAGVGVSINTQINRLSLFELDDIFERLLEVGAHGWQIQLTVPMGRAADMPEVLLQPYDLLEVYPRLAELADRCKEKNILLWPGNNIGYFGPYESKFRGTTLRGHLGSCSAGRSTLGIEANGAIKGCPSLPTEAWTGGNIRENSLKDIWERAGAMRYTRDRTVKDLWGFCGDCYYADECRSGCTWTGFTMFGKPGNNPYCHHRALEYQKKGMREVLLPAQSAPGKPFDHGEFQLIVERLDPTDPTISQGIVESDKPWS